MKKKKPKVFVGMSGGVDSSVAAALLLRENYDVVGIHMRCYNVDGCAEQDAEDARHAAETLGIPFYTFDFEEEYKKQVVAYMVEGYRNGSTPNPDVMCNREIKFGLFLKKALAFGADFVATGHYIRLRQTKQITNNKELITRSRKSSVISYQLFQALDSNKDQSYFLWTLTQKELQHCLFPLGKYTKPQVRVLAKKFGLPNAQKKDSQGICFLGQVSLVDFLKDYIPEKKGAIVTTEGKRVGTHQGATYYTIGQRHGLGVAFGVPAYVSAKDVKQNTITVAKGETHPALYRKEIELTDMNFINPQHPYILENVRMSVYARVRYRQKLVQADLQLMTDNDKQAKLIFKKPVKFVASGQSAVFYKRSPSTRSGSKSKDFEMLGGGIIV